MDKQWWAGNELVKRWDIHDMELYDHVKEGLQPYNDDRMPIPPPKVKELEYMVWTYKRELKKLEEYFHEFRGTIISRDEWRKLNSMSEANVKPTTAFYSDGSTTEARDYYKDIKNRLQQTERDLQKYPSRPLWKDADFHKEGISPNSIKKLLLNAYYKLDDILKFEILHKHITLTETDGNHAGNIEEKEMGSIDAIAKVEAANFFTRENSSVWHIGFKGKDVRIKHLDGFLYIAYLLNPSVQGNSISCRQLYDAVSGKIPDIIISEDKAINQGLHVESQKQSIGARETRKICTERYEDLKDRLSVSSMEEQEKIKEEMAKLKPYMKFKERNFPDPNDKKAQANIKKRLEKAYETLRNANMTDLTKHLQNHIKTDDNYGLRYTGSITWNITQ